VPSRYILVYRAGLGETEISGGLHDKTHPCKTKEGVSTKLDKNKSLSSGVKELSRIARRNGSMK
jgi:hypothetical protein